MRDRSGEATTLNNIGLVYAYIGQKQKAFEYYEKSLPFLQEIGEKANEAALLANLMLVWNDLNKRSLAIFYGKRSVNGFQQLRRHISGLEKDIRMTYLKSREDAYRDLADLLVTAGLPDWLGKGKEPAANPDNPKPGFRDAYKWGPFIMMGNFR